MGENFLLRIGGGKAEVFGEELPKSSKGLALVGGEKKELSSKSLRLQYSFEKVSARLMGSLRRVTFRSLLYWAVMVKFCTPTLPRPMSNRLR